MDSLEARPLTGTEGVYTFFWSPDSRSVAFASAGKLKKIDISGGPPQTLCDIPSSGQVAGGSWNADSVILFGTPFTPILRVSAAGGSASPVTALDSSRGETMHGYPTFLPDGRHFVYLRRSGLAEATGIFSGSLDAPRAGQSLKRIQAAEFSPAYAPAAGPRERAHILFLRERALMAQPFDENRLETAGEAVVIADQVGSSLSRAAFSVSSNGILAYRTGAGAGRQLGWFDRQGHMVGRAGEFGDYQDVAISPDGGRVAHNQGSQGSPRQVWVLDLARGANTRLSFATEGCMSPAWSPDGKRLAFSSTTQSVHFALYVKDASNSGGEQPVFQSSDAKILNDWSRDGHFLLYTELSSKSAKFHLWALPLIPVGGERKPIAVVNSEFNETQGQVSPDSRWVAYASDLSGKYEIYVRAFPPGDGRSGQWLVSSAGGVAPRWRADGKELYYATGGTLMAVDVTPGGPKASAFQAGAPHPLFSTPMLGSSTSFTYDVAQDGKRGGSGHGIHYSSNDGGAELGSRVEKMRLQG